jgi:hypothetical protein
MMTPIMSRSLNRVTRFSIHTRDLRFQKSWQLEGIKYQNPFKGLIPILAAGLKRLVLVSIRF